DGAVNRVFFEIISACRALQGPIEISFLGPEATFSHQAALDYFGRSAGFLPQESISDVFKEVEENRADFGIVPVENSTGGVIGLTLDHLIETDLKVCGEVHQRISQALMSLEEDCGRIKRVISHPQALIQCRGWLARNLPAAKLVETPSTAAAAIRATKTPASAMVGSEMLADLHGLRVLAREIQDRPFNLTRFLILGRLESPRTGRDKTSVLFATPHRPGALCRCLKPLAEFEVNLTHIESRPSGQKPWEYVFFIDFEGHLADDPVRAALEGLAGGVDKLKILGSYPRGQIAGPEISQNDSEEKLTGGRSQRAAVYGNRG
ncbi:MAG: prephenate dehydratase, partial [Deltaproteobacteria bacterium]|nr:prephenate dehydratase [Deltaproteobacteria bacterium]